MGSCESTVSKSTLVTSSADCKNELLDHEDCALSFFLTLILALHIFFLFMALVQISPTIIPLAPPPSVAASRASDHSVDGQKSDSDEHLQLPVLASPDPHDPPPFVPLANDYVSLGQLRVRRRGNILDERQRETPGLLRRYSSDLTHRYNGAEADFVQHHDEDTKAGSEKSLDLPLRRNTAPCESAAYHQSVFELSHGYNQPNDNESLCVSTVFAPTSTSTSREFRGSVHTRKLRAPGYSKELHSIKPPSQIRLRKASKRDSICRGKRSSAIFPLMSGQHPYGSNHLQYKSSTLSEALTHTSIHSFLPVQQDKPGSSTSTESDRRLSATLQVVRSGDSVYEVIWEDRYTAIEESRTRIMTSGLDVSFPREPTTAVEGLSTTDQLPIETSLAAWSWTGELERDSHSRESSFSSESSDMEESAAVTEMCLEKPHSSGDVLATKQCSGIAGSIQVNHGRHKSTFGDGNNFTSSAVDPGDEPVIANSSDLKPCSELKVLPVLHKCGFSDSFNEENHFQKHRDSLILAHQRMLQQHRMTIIQENGTANNKVGHSCQGLR